MQPVIFPEVAPGKWLEVNLNNEFVKLLSTGENPMISKNFQERWIGELASKLGCDYTYGGFLEDRSQILESFEKTGYMRHLGIDLNNLPPHTPITVPVEVQVFDIFNDPTKHNGWGTRLILKLAQPYNGADYLLYGHLAVWPELKVGQQVKAGEIVGYLGDPEENGGWFSHLHVQLLKQKFVDLYAANIPAIDGYSLNPDDGLSELVSDPTNLVFTNHN